MYKPTISDERVRAATGKAWDEWFRILDEAGCSRKSHKEIVRILDENHPHVGAWWQQSVTVQYEKARGLRKEHEKADGFAVSASKTVNVPVGELFAAFTDEERRASWLPDPIEIRGATEGKSVRITWNDGSRVDVYLTGKGPSKSQVSVQHAKLPNQESAERVKGEWRDRLSTLRTVLEE